MDEGIKTTEKDGISYIVHPAFMDNKENNYNNGGWTEDLSGIWVAKYEMSKEVNKEHKDTTAASDAGDNSGDVETNELIKAVSVPGVTSWRNITVGNCYTNGQNYDEGKESHLMKNSEWGAVAYLTHSQYGRNGVEITQNTDSGFFTGGETGATATFNELQSSTGNSYGIYDLSGCAYEYIAAYDQAATSTDPATYGKSFAKKDGTSTEYSTTYTNGTDTSLVNKIYKVGKIGDATKEVYTGSSDYSWFTDYSYFVNSSNPFFKHGGYYGSGGAGVFCSGYNDGNYDDNFGLNCYSWRVVLIGF